MNDNYDNLEGRNDKNIEERIKEIATQIQEDYDKKLDQKIKHEKEELLNKIFNMLPYNDKEKEHMKLELIEKDENDKKDEADKKQTVQINEIVLEEVEFEGNKYFYDKLGRVWDQNANVVGSVDGINKERKPEKIFFLDDPLDIDTDEDITKYIPDINIKKRD